MIELFVAISNKSFNEMEKISSYLLFEEKNEISQPEFQFFLTKVYLISLMAQKNKKNIDDELKLEKIYEIYLNNKPDLTSQVLSNLLKSKRIAKVHK